MAAFTGEVSYTTVKFRPGFFKKEAIDYIWFSGDQLDCEEVVDAPEEALLCEEGLPTAEFPSDHLSVVATLQWRAKPT